MMNILFTQIFNIIVLKYIKFLKRKNLVLINAEEITEISHHANF